MTEEQKQISAINWQRAWNHFVSVGEMPEDKKRYNLHHIDTSLKHRDIERYIQWNIEDLIVLSVSEHMKLHWQLDKDLGRYSDRCRKMSESHKGKPSNFKGKHFTEEQKKKMSESCKGKHKGKHWKLVDGKRVYY